MTRAIHIVKRSALLLLAVWLPGVPAYGDAPATPSPLTGTAKDRIVAFADVHGAASELRALLLALTLIDESGNWTGGRTRLVSLGDLLDRGPDSRAVMDLLMKLEAQAGAAGGAVHLVLGNHELMNMTGDLRYVSSAEYAAFKDDEDPEERASAYREFRAALEAEAAAADAAEQVDVRAAFNEKFPPGYFAHRAAFAPEGTYGAWLLAKPQILELDGIAFVHGGLSSAFVEQPFEAYNASAQAELRALLDTGHRLVETGSLPPWQDLATGNPSPDQTLPADFLALRGSLQFDTVGPAWYRGTAACHPLIERPRFEAVLSARALDRIVMGHTPTSPRIIQTRFEGRAVLADTGMYAEYYKGRPSAAIFDAGEMRTLTLLANGELIAQRGKPEVDLRAGPQQKWLENVAKALERTTLAPEASIAFEANGRQLEAIWHTDSRRRQSARLAAFALDRLLGFGLVAPVMRLEQAGRSGVVEVVPAATLSETARVTGNIFRPNYCASGSDFDLLLVLDALMGQEARNGTNLSYDRVNWLIYLTEQHKAFSTQVRLPRYMANQSIVLAPLVIEKLRSLDQDMLVMALGEYLNNRQIQAILGRRDLILERWPPAQ